MHENLVQLWLSRLAVHAYLHTWMPSDEHGAWDTMQRSQALWITRALPHLHSPEAS